MAKRKTTAPDPFAAASKRSARAAAPADKAPKGTFIRLPEHDKEASQALSAFRAGKLQIKAAEGQVKAGNEVLTPLVLDLVAGLWAASGERPEGPITVVNARDEKLTYVMQDKTAGGALRVDELAQLQAVLPGVESMVVEEEEFAFDADVLNEPGVRTKLAKAIAAAKLTKSQQERLLVRTQVYRLDESLVPHLAKLAKKDAHRLAAALKAIPRLFVRYLKT